MITSIHADRHLTGLNSDSWLKTLRKLGIEENLIKCLCGKPTANIIFNVGKIKFITRQLPTRQYMSPFPPFLPPVLKFFWLSPFNCLLPGLFPVLTFLRILLNLEEDGCLILKASNRKLIHVCSPGGHSKSKKPGESVDSGNFIKSSLDEGGTSWFSSKSPNE